MTPCFFSESNDSLKILGNPWIHWFLNFPYDIYTGKIDQVNDCRFSDKNRLTSTDRQRIVSHQEDIIKFESKNWSN